MIYPAMKLQRSYAHYVIQNKMFNRTASTAEYAWASIFVVYANSSMMMFQRINTTVTNVVSAELEAWITFSIVRDADVATPR
ncbi:hypothetical protein RIF29_38978 [Crotalaria pallida]|uniref:Uncharacterized protein n=1 Tax=Crotalaria pallida TaxID=3830 RepID=A0AAN9E101_CROPI